jgi:ornithine carbamoyltransferase
MAGKRDFLQLTDYSAEEVLALMTRARELKALRLSNDHPRPLLGRTVAMIFEKPSTRTRVSFEAGVCQLGGGPIALNRNDIQLSRGEPVKDTARALARYVDCIVLRTFSHDTLLEMARYSEAPVINGLTDLLHPCQTLADLFTLWEAGVNIHTMKVAWIGDGNNMANSWINASEVFGFDLALACPEGYEPDLPVDGVRVRLTRDPKEAVQDKDVVCTDVWASMGQEDQITQRRRSFEGYQVNSELLKYASSEVKALHCLPAHRGEEITEEVMESRHSLIWDEAENRLHVQKALMEKLITDWILSG